MFFPEKIKNINPNEKVLEIGPGAFPHPKADVFLDKKFSNEKETLMQNGFAQGIKLQKPLFFYDGGKFPFKENEFDYVICSHVIEHVEKKELNNFIKELTRVARKGYIEFPTIFYELINFQQVHRWFMTFEKGEILFLEKNHIPQTNITPIIQDLFFGSGSKTNHIIEIYKELFFFGFEWDNKKINYKIVSSINELVPNKSIDRYQRYIKKINSSQSEKASNTAEKGVLANIRACLKKFSNPN